MPETNLVNNWLFAAMSEADQDTLLPTLVRQALTQGDVLFRTGDALDLIHFPVSAQIANVMVFDTGESRQGGGCAKLGLQRRPAWLKLQGGVRRKLCNRTRSSRGSDRNEMAAIVLPAPPHMK